MTERTEEEVEWLNRIRTMEKLDRELFTRKETFYAIKYESEKEIRDISKMVKDSRTTLLKLPSAKIEGLNKVKRVSKRYKIAGCAYPIENCSFVSF